ncbi:MAG: hypothetical protein SP1CHLAM54_06270 [Chlamydiia bacterium]|nr:hypothetical protein [Chlamydiia bacterium]MCH9615537.1 hypothetical protein [Chlamydiia bacterium]MCH9629192.1 hypothetical protein [Chlamydiia bacterium]
MASPISVNLGTNRDPISRPDPQGWVKIGDMEVRMVMRDSSGNITSSGAPNIPRIDQFARALLNALPQAQSALASGKSILLNATSLTTKNDGEETYSNETTIRGTVRLVDLPDDAQDALAFRASTAAPHSPSALNFSDVWNHMIQSARSATSISPPVSSAPSSSRGQRRPSPSHHTPTLAESYAASHSALRPHLQARSRPPATETSTFSRPQVTRRTSRPPQHQSAIHTGPAIEMQVRRRSSLDHPPHQASLPPRGFFSQPYPGQELRHSRNTSDTSTSSTQQSLSSKRSSSQSHRRTRPRRARRSVPRAYSPGMPTTSSVRTTIASPPKPRPAPAVQVRRAAATPNGTWTVDAKTAAEFFAKEYNRTHNRQQQIPLHFPSQPDATVLSKLAVTAASPFYICDRQNELVQLFGYLGKRHLAEPGFKNTLTEEARIAIDKFHKSKGKALPGIL